VTNGPLVEMVAVKVHFPVSRGVVFRHKVGTIKAIDGVDLTVERGETLGIVGESGCGKSTLARALLQLTPTTEGTVLFKGQDLATLSASELRAERRHMQLVFQDPYASLNPRMSVGAAIQEPIRLHGLRDTDAAVRARVAELLDIVGLRRDFASRFPHQLSGGQRQRVGIARALASEPDLIVCDEAVSALDVSVQAQVLNLLRQLQERMGLTYVFIAHNLTVIRYLSKRIAVMYLGKIVEIGTASGVMGNPRHPYTRALLSAVPLPSPKLERERRRIVIEGDVPSPFNPPEGCAFANRCPMAVPACKTHAPPLVATAEGEHSVACWRTDDIDSLMPL